MKLNKIASNITELTLGNNTIYFSYNTPVCGFDDEGAFRTDEHYSQTTSKHINKYLGGKDIGRVVSQDFINNLVGA